MTQRHDDSGESGPRQTNDDDVVDGLVKAPEPNWHMYEENQAWIDRIIKSRPDIRETLKRDIAARGGPEPYPGIRGYAHSWVVKDGTSPQTQTIVADVQALADQCDFKMRTPRDKCEDFTLGPDRISLNAEVDGGGTFEYPPDRKRNVEIGVIAGYGVCITDAMPYDALVGAALLAIKHHLGDDVKVQSKGGPQHPAWQAAKALYSRTFPERVIPWLDNWPDGSGTSLGRPRPRPERR